jgi:hypothetical protein
MRRPRAKVDYNAPILRWDCGRCGALAMFRAFTEGMALFVSFAMLLNFPRHNKDEWHRANRIWSARDESSDIS